MGVAVRVRAAVEGHRRDKAVVTKAAAEVVVLAAHMAIVVLVAGVHRHCIAVAKAVVVEFLVRMLHKDLLANIRMKCILSEVDGRMEIHRLLCQVLRDSRKCFVVCDLFEVASHIE